MPGKPHSPFPYQQKPYVNQRVHGKSVDKHGKKVSNDSLKARISKEMGQLKQTGKLEQAIDSTCESWLTKSPTEAYITAKNGGKHARLIELLGRRSAKEVRKSIKSLKKQIVNPSKYCPEWDRMDPRRQSALINKRWPAEIQCFTEERDILQTVLEQIIEN